MVALSCFFYSPLNRAESVIELSPKSTDGGLVNWDAIDTVILDMDGTLLDLSFDSHFWLKHVPKHFQLHSGLSQDASLARFEAIFTEHRGTLRWYCTEFWSEALGFDVLALKAALADGVRYRVDAVAFLRFLREQGKRTIIATNAHPDTVLIKHQKTGVLSEVDAWFSSHQFGAAKENPDFWQALRSAESFNSARTLFVDDGEHILATAERCALEHLVHVASPESEGPLQPSQRYHSIDRFAEIAPL